MCPVLLIGCNVASCSVKGFYFDVDLSSMYCHIILLNFAEICSLKIDCIFSQVVYISLHISVTKTNPISNLNPKSKSYTSNPLHCKRGAQFQGANNVDAIGTDWQSCSQSHVSRCKQFRRYSGIHFISYASYIESMGKKRICGCLSG